MDHPVDTRPPLQELAALTHFYDFEEPCIRLDVRGHHRLQCDVYRFP
jgi:hypothetical protein